MPFDLPASLVLVTLTFLLAGFVKGVVGLGLPTIAMGLLSLAMAPAQAAALLIVPSLVTNVWQLGAGSRVSTLLRRLWPMQAGVVLGTVSSAGVLQSQEAGLASAGLGVALVIYAGLGLSAPRVHVPAPTERWLGPVVGVATGLVTGMTGVFVIPAVPYLAALGFSRDELIQALGLSFTVSTVALAFALAGGGSLGVGAATASLLTLIPALAGMMVGGWVRGRISEGAFRRCFFLSLLALGFYLALRKLV
ncbi:sulfite exporter TauE/SafE family protein [Rubellimicrobium roseum]|uniref:Probable membrane transporter protein n=1 Tax=Rubellimicrobium roseum TaxID=687525 RepID=A0A5C4NB97_9RHOB|nr:sulfite exporter TauE/SafE family protein [Rubellimicrobium roseum]TNC66285.1 sulfite exporter TauE/SafE family protein [Rubellimicrobium roseum]